ncbi:hypothetical protein R5R35_013779 [Gryllus longicercus]|uniref:Uncharacterized protein n=1 Tax=Gryllus longicercus TaxID=2509291 RepID=A0AAN9VW32_9ORTH
MSADPPAQLFSWVPLRKWRATKSSISAFNNKNLLCFTWARPHRSRPSAQAITLATPKAARRRAAAGRLSGAQESAASENISPRQSTSAARGRFAQRAAGGGGGDPRSSQSKKPAPDPRFNEHTMAPHMKFNTMRYQILHGRAAAVNAVL